MDPTRSGAVLARHAGIDEDTGQLTADQDGGPRRLVISSDFYAVYQSAGKKADGLVNLFCWAHIRRYFVRAGDADPARLTYWTDAWLERIKGLYAAHEELTAAWNGAAAPAPRDKTAAAARLDDARAAWDAAITVIDETRKKQMAAPGLAEPAKKALATLDREWDGLIAHRDYPMIGLDNNPAERMIRGPVVTRKNAGGSRNGDTARNAAVIWTVTATAQMAGLNLLTWLTAYLDECGRNGGKPLAGPALERFLPWNASPEDLRTWAQPPPRPDKPARIRPHRRARRTGHAGHQHAISQDFRILTPDQPARPVQQRNAGILRIGNHLVDRRVADKIRQPFRRGFLSGGHHVLQALTCHAPGDDCLHLFGLFCAHSECPLRQRNIRHTGITCTLSHRRLNRLDRAVLLPATPSHLRRAALPADGRAVPR